jgi:hypothetical protein
LCREDAKSAFGGSAGGHSLGLSWLELSRRRFSIAASTWRPTDIWYSRRYCTRRGSSSAKWWVSGCCVFQTASCAASPTATRKSSSSMFPRSRAMTASVPFPNHVLRQVEYPQSSNMKPAFSNCPRRRFLIERVSSKNWRQRVAGKTFLRRIRYRRLMT